MKNAHRVKNKPWIVHCCREQFIYKYWFLLKYERQSGFAFVSADEEAFKLIQNIQVLKKWETLKDMKNNTMLPLKIFLALFGTSGENTMDFH